MSSAVTTSATAHTVLRTALRAVLTVGVLGAWMAVWWCLVRTAEDEAAKPRSDRRLILEVEQALVGYQVDHDEPCPPRIDDLYTLGYLTREPRDRRGEPFDYACPGVHARPGADIVAKGKDRRAGTADDVRSWEL